jgi:hypothetical protein
VLEIIICSDSLSASFSLSLISPDFEAFICHANLIRSEVLVKLNALVKSLFLEKSIVMF